MIARFRYFLFFLLLLPNVFAENYYVSPIGNAAWAEAVNINAPCSIATAMANAAADDVVYFRGGTYDVAAITGSECTYSFQSSHMLVANSGTSGHPITFQAYPGEIPILNDTLAAGQTRCSVLGIISKNHIILDGFTIQADNGAKLGFVYIVGASFASPATGNIFRNMTINGGSTVLTGGTNYEALRVENTRDTLIQKVKLYNVQGDDPNTSAYKGYHNVNLVFENNELFDSYIGAYEKSGCTDCTYRYNYVHNTDNGWRWESSTVSPITNW